MRVLHLASFSGNIGDGANHRGFYKNFKRYISDDAIFDECEIRKFYKSWGERTFDESFIKEVNQYDLLVIGGGNFFEICWDYSCTGTTIALSEEVLERIKTPIFINGMGFDTTKGFSLQTKKAFFNFFSLLKASPNIFMTFRNDGSKLLLEECYGKESTESVICVPDGGFFFELNKENTNRINASSCKKLGICVAKDMASRRFPKEGFEGFAKRFALWLKEFCEERCEYSLCFVPHIFSDISAIYDIISLLPDPIRRQRVSVAMLNTSNPWSIDPTFEAYSDCDLVLSMRFHGNVVCIGNDIPTLGLTTGRKYGLLYEELGIPDRHIQLQEDEMFWEELSSAVGLSLSNPNAVSARYREINRGLEEKIKAVYGEINHWLMA